MYRGLVLALLVVPTAAWSLTLELSPLPDPGVSGDQLFARIDSLDLVHFESGGPQRFLQANRAGRRSTSSTPCDANADGRLAHNPFLACLVNAGTPETIKESAQTLTEVAEIDWGRKDDRVGRTDLVHQRGKIVIDDTFAFRSADAPAMIIALAAPLDLHLGQKHPFSFSTLLPRPLEKCGGGFSCLSVVIAAS